MLSPVVIIAVIRGFNILGTRSVVVCLGRRHAIWEFLVFFSTVVRSARAGTTTSVPLASDAFISYDETQKCACFDHQSPC